MKQSTTTQRFIDLYTQESDSLFRYCFFRVSDRDQAIDITQESFMRTWDQLTKDDSGIKNSRALLFKIASNMIIDWYRKKKAVSLDALLEPDDHDSVLQLADDSFDQIEISSDGKTALARISSLDQTYQRVIYLRFVEDLSPKEIAAVTGFSANVVSVRISRGLQELRKKYGLQ